MNRFVLARRMVSVVAALTTLYGLSAGPCRHSDAARGVAIASGDAGSSGSHSADGGCHGATAASEQVERTASHDQHSDSRDAERCHCLGACCCTPSVGMGGVSIVQEPIPAVHHAPVATHPDAPAPRRGNRLLPPSTAPPSPLVAA